MTSKGRIARLPTYVCIEIYGDTHDTCLWSSFHVAMYFESSSFRSWQTEQKTWHTVGRRRKSNKP